MDKTTISDKLSILLVIICTCLFWVFLFKGICDEMDRRDKVSQRKWVHERALNEYDTERQPELIKAMQEVKNGWQIPQKR